MAHIGHPILGDTMYPIPQQFMDVISTPAETTTLIPTTTTVAESVVGIQALTGGADDPAVEPERKTRDTWPTEEEEMLELLQPLEGRIILTTESAPPVRAPRVDTAFPRLCLHALRLSFTHPVTKAPTTLCALTTDSHMVQAPPQLIAPIQSKSIDV